MANRDVTSVLWLLKLGTVFNAAALVWTLSRGWTVADPQIVMPALVLFAVSAYRCALPNRYKDNVVFHDTVLSSTLVTRVLATFSEVAWIVQLAYVLRLLDSEPSALVTGLSGVMIVAVVVSQCFVWGAIALGRLSLYVYEELGWFVIFVANTLASAMLLAGPEVSGVGKLLLGWSLVFGAGYLPWQLLHLRSLFADASTQAPVAAGSKALGKRVAGHLRRALNDRRRATDAEAWGGTIGITWMVAYWATLVPGWCLLVVYCLAPQ